MNNVLFKLYVHFVLLVDIFLLIWVSQFQIIEQIWKQKWANVQPEGVQ